MSWWYPLGLWIMNIKFLPSLFLPQYRYCWSEWNSWQSHTVVEARSPRCSDLDIVQALVLSQVFTVLSPKPKDVKRPDEESKCKQKFIKDWIVKEIFLLDEEGRKVFLEHEGHIKYTIWNASDCNTKILCMRGFVVCLSPLLVIFFSWKIDFKLKRLCFSCYSPVFVCICFPAIYSVKHHQHSLCLPLGNWRSFAVPWPRMGGNYGQKETLWLVRSCHFEICSYDQRIHCVSIKDFALHLEVIILCFAE